MLFSISNFRFSFHNLGMCRTASLTLWTWCTVGTEGGKLLLRMWSQCWGRTRPRSCLEHPVVSARPSPWGKQQSSNLVPPLPQLHWLLQHCIAPWTQLSGGKGCGSAGRLSCTLRPLNVTGSAWWPRWPAGNYSTTLRCRLALRPCSVHSTRRCSSSTSSRFGGSGSVSEMLWLQRRRDSDYIRRTSTAKKWDFTSLSLCT